MSHLERLVSGAYTSVLDKFPELEGADPPRFPSVSDKPNGVPHTSSCTPDVKLYTVRQVVSRHQILSSLPCTRSGNTLRSHAKVGLP